MPTQLQLYLPAPPVWYISTCPICPDKPGYLFRKCLLWPALGLLRADSYLSPMELGMGMNVPCLGRQISIQVYLEVRKLPIAKNSPFFLVLLSVDIWNVLRIWMIRCQISCKLNSNISILFRQRSLINLHSETVYTLQAGLSLVCRRRRCHWMRGWGGETVFWFDPVVISCWQQRYFILPLPTLRIRVSREISMPF